MSDDDAPAAVAATLDAWRTQGAQQADPVRFRFIEAMARRAAAHEGDARRLIDDRLARLIAAYAADLRQRAPEQDGAAGNGPAAPPASAEGGRPGRGPLAELVDHIARQGAADADSPPGIEGAGTGERGMAAALAAPPELKALRYFRRTWSRLSTDQRLTQSLAKVPDNAGPLHSHHLVHQSLTLMRTLSPGYLDRFMSYVDALLWLDQVNGGEPPRKPGRGKPG